MQGGYVSPSPAGPVGQNSVASGSLAAGAVTSGTLASGSVAWPHHSSGCVASGHVGNAAVVSGSVASGAVAKQHTASGLLQEVILFAIRQDGAAVASGDKGELIVPFDCKINWVNVFSDQSGGSVFAGIWKAAYAGYPPTSGGTIAPSGVPLISGAVRNTYSGTAALSGWTTSLSKGDVLKFVAHSGLTMTRVTVALQVGVGD